MSCGFWQNKINCSCAEVISGVWTPRAFTRTWTSVASSADGTKLVACAYYDDYIYTSTDSGITWTQRGVMGLWKSVASSADGTKLVACSEGGGGGIYTSIDSGVTWIKKSTSPAQEVTSSNDGINLAYAGNSNYLGTSIDSGVNWTQRSDSLSWTDIASSGSGDKLIASASNGKLYVSVNYGVSWVEKSTTGNCSGVTISKDGTVMIGAKFGGANFYISHDSGATFITVTPTTGIFGYLVYLASSSDCSKIVAVGTNGHINISTDFCATWTQEDSARDWRGVAASDDFTKLVAVAYSGLIYTIER